MQVEADFNFEYFDRMTVSGYGSEENTILDLFRHTLSPIDKRSSRLSDRVSVELPFERFIQAILDVVEKIIQSHLKRP